MLIFKHELIHLMINIDNAKDSSLHRSLFKSMIKNLFGHNLIS